MANNDGLPATRGFQHAAADTTAPTVNTPDLTTGSDSGSSHTDDITKDNTPTITGPAWNLQAHIDVADMAKRAITNRASEEVQKALKNGLGGLFKK